MRLLITVSRMLLAPARRAPRGVRLSASVLHDGKAPAPAGQLAGHGHGGHRGALAATIEAAPAAVQTAFGGDGAFAHQGALAFAAASEFTAGSRLATMVPGRFDQQAPGMTVAGLGDRPLTATLAGGTCRSARGRGWRRSSARRSTAESPISVARPKAVRVETPRRHERRPTTPTPGLFQAGSLLGDRRIEGVATALGAHDGPQRLLVGDRQAALCKALPGEPCSWPCVQAEPSQTSPWRSSSLLMR